MPCPMSLIKRSEPASSPTCPAEGLGDCSTFFKFLLFVNHNTFHMSYSDVPAPFRIADEELNATACDWDG